MVEARTHDAALQEAGAPWTDEARDRLARAFADIASAAGAAVMDVYATDFAVRRKDDRSPVCDADEAAEAIILEALAARVPDLPVIAEEQISAGRGPATCGDCFILVDPLDGTKEFINRRDEFTVNIALVAGGAPLAGCVYAPALGRIYIGGATAAAAALTPGDRASDAAWAPLATRAYGPDGLDAIVSRSHLDPQTEGFLRKIQMRGTLSAGSSLKFCRVAEGAADVYPRFGPTMEWDVAAGHAVLAAAGGRVVTPEGAPFVYGKEAESFRNGAFVAWGREALVTAGD